MARERILITVKTYPTLSRTYGELVCTAGLREDGSWIRIYPVPFRRLEEYKQFEKFRFIDALVIRNSSDPRPESHKVDLDSLVLSEEKLPTNDFWRERRDWVLKRGVVHDDLAELITAANQRNEISLATFKPAEIIEFITKPETAEWDAGKLAELKKVVQHGELFDQWRNSDLTSLVKKLPWKFSYRLRDCKRKESTMMIEDWEIGALYWNCVWNGATPEEAVGKVRQRYLDEFAAKDLHLFLGTTREWHGRGSNPFVIIGVFYPPYQLQPELF